LSKETLITFKRDPLTHAHLSQEQIRAAELERNLADTSAELDRQRREHGRRADEAAAEIQHLRQLVEEAEARALLQDAARQADLTSVRRQLEESVRECGALREQVAELSLRAVVTVEEFARMRRELEALQADRAASDPELRRLRELVADLERKKAGWERERGAVAAENARMVAELQGQSERLRECERLLCAGRNDIDALQVCLSVCTLNPEPCRKSE
jgi:chromosome segregation ATPase